MKHINIGDMEMEWVLVASVDQIEVGTVISVNLNDREIALYHLEDGNIYATDNICTHGLARLSEGWLEDGVIECPLHAGRFDVKTGKALCAPLDLDVEVIEVRQEDGKIWIRLEQPS